jgi:malonyl-CoA O-methyltransferase
MNSRRPSTNSRSGLSDQVRHHFGRRAAVYEAQALLQRAVACRLGRLCRDLPLPAGPRADLGAGSGLLSRALAAQGLLQLDLCPELLQRNPQQPHLVWDLNDGLPSPLQGAALLASGFALQWLDDPASQLAQWCRALAPGGWLALAVPTAGSFPQWRRAAAAAGVPCTALDLPAADRLVQAAAAAGLHPHHSQVLRFSRPEQGGLAALRHLRSLGATASPQPPLGAGELRRLLAHWPVEESLTWEVLLLVGHRDHPAPSAR